MPKVYVYDSYDNKFFRYTLRENDPMPYSTDTTLRVREFRRWGSAKRRRLLILDLSAGIINLPPSGRGPRSCTILYKEVFPHGYAGVFAHPPHLPPL